ncbi:MAG TPA: ABC transporter ATP-binding protein [Tepidisphaeraceae bacterium]|nr:ABC transporter ATP-binding protein [Tepidisphaeraceae bacterium]
MSENRSTLLSRLRFYFRAVTYFRTVTGKIVVQTLLMGVAALMGILQPFPLAILIDGVFGNNRGAWEDRLFFHFAPASVAAQVIWLAVITLGLRVLQELLNMVQTILGIFIGYEGLMRVRCELFKKLQELSIAYHRSQPQGDAIYRLSYDTYGFQVVLNVMLQTILVSLITLLLMLGTMLAMNWKLTLVSLAVVPPLLWTTRYYSRIFKQKSLDAKETDSEVTTAIQRSVSSISLVQAFGREAEEYRRFETTVQRSVRTWLKLHWQEVTYWLWIGTIFGAGGALLFGYGGLLVWRDRVSHNPHPFQVGDLTVFLWYLTLLYAPLNKLSSSGASIQGGVAGVERVFEVLDRDPVIKDAPDAMPLPRQPRLLELDHVSFEYRGNEPVLRDVTVKIAPGEMVGFVGSSGVGKTTLLNLLPRFYDPTAGSLKLDGHDLRKIRIHDLRAHIALVLQENIILPTSVAENIAYGRPEANPAQIRRAAEMAGAAVFIDKLPQKYETVISEAGSNLSGGQRQRIGIARALLTEAPILVLDEPTSALDPQHEAMIIQTLSALKRQRTMLVVSHRLSTVADCDQIFVMDEGRIVEQGTHAQLLEKRGLYYSMARHQLRLDEVPEAAAQ